MNVIEEISKAVLGDEVGEMTPLEYADYLKELLDKSEKYDKIQECVPFVRHLAFEQVVREYKTMQDKLEAIKKWQTYWLCNPDLNLQAEKAINEIGEILESSEFHRKVRN